ncbi:hypothetical protein E2C01_072673 [Portunus trituberculatus]|uniref:Uncharacterized protein n=1 Tax=Portunus trituberculatus TaxID=210409 RepID=A0A5B7HYN9_PORTR|nr:hypothetical protein [Portunus trituberculatus]
MTNTVTTLMHGERGRRGRERREKRESNNVVMMVSVLAWSGLALPWVYTGVDTEGATVARLC